MASLDLPKPIPVLDTLVALVVLARSLGKEKHLNYLIIQGFDPTAPVSFVTFSTEQKC